MGGFWSGMINHCNEAINKVGAKQLEKGNIFGDLWGNVQLQRQAQEAGKAAFADMAFVNGKGVRRTKNVAGKGYMRAIENTFRNADGSVNYKRAAGAAAGTYMGISAAGRIVSGGGLYRDSGGNFDIIGVPFI